MDVLKTMTFLMGQPWLALVPTAVFALCAVATGSRVAFVVAGLWGFYCLYELGMKHRILCSGECNIRIDLLALYPLLLLATVIGLLAVLVRAVRRAS